MRASFLLVPLALALATGAVRAEPSEPLAARQADWQDASTAVDLLGMRDLSGPATFALSAAAIHVHSETADAYAMTPDRKAFYAVQVTQEDSDLANASLQVAAGRDGSFLYVLPTAATVAMPCGSAAPASGLFQAQEQVKMPNSNPVIDLGQALLLQPCGPVQVCGAFTVVLWERDASGSSRDGPVSIETGQLQRPGEPDARPLLGRARQAYLSTDDGCLSMGAGAGSAAPGPGQAPEILARSASLGDASQVVLRGGRGSLALPAGTVPVDGDVRAAGRIDAALARSGDGLGVGLGGRIARLDVDGRPVALATTAAASAGPRWALGASLAAALSAAALAALWLRGNRAGALERRAEQASRERAWGQVMLLTDRRLRRGDDARVRILRAKALLALEDHPQALSQARLALLRLPDGPTKADAALVACRAASRLGRDGEALQWLGEVYAQDGRTAEQALRFPEVARLAAPADLGYT